MRFIFHHEVEQRLVHDGVKAVIVGKLGMCHIHKIALSATLDLHSHVHQLQSTFAQLAVRTFWTSVYILLHYVPCTFDPVSMMMGASRTHG